MEYFCAVLKQSFNSSTSRGLKVKIARELNTRKIAREQYATLLSPSLVKCSCCDWLIPKYDNFEVVGDTVELKRSIFACLRPECSSHSIKMNSIDYRTKVLGKDLDLILSKNKERLKKSARTKKENGFYSDISNNPYSKEFWINKGLSEEEAVEYLKTKATKMVATKIKNGFYDGISNNPFSKEYWICAGLTKEEAINKTNSRNHFRSEYWISKGHGVDEADTLSKRAAATNTLQSYERKGYSEEDALEALSSRRLSQSANWSPRSGRNLPFGSSKAADKLIRKIYKKLRRLGLNRNDFMADLCSGEYYIRDGSKIYFYDLYIKPLDLILEYNGSHVHVNKDKLTADEFDKWKHAYTKKSADEVHDHDQRKILTAKNKHKHVLVVWDTDDIDSAINTILDIAKKRN